MKRSKSRSKSPKMKSPQKVRFSVKSPIKPYVRREDPTAIMRNYEAQNGKLDVERLTKTGIWK